MSRKALRQQDTDESSMFTLASFHTLRIEALNTFSGIAACIPKVSSTTLNASSKCRWHRKSPPLELLSQIAEDVHQRLLGLRQRPL